jgi:hypothetical protein
MGGLEMSKVDVETDRAQLLGLRRRLEGDSRTCRMKPSSRVRRPVRTSPMSPSTWPILVQTVSSSKLRSACSRTRSRSWVRLRPPWSGWSEVILAVARHAEAGFLRSGLKRFPTPAIASIVPTKPKSNFLKAWAYRRTSLVGSNAR